VRLGVGKMSSGVGLMRLGVGTSFRRCGSMCVSGICIDGTLLVAGGSVAGMGGVLLAVGGCKLLVSLATGGGVLVVDSAEANLITLCYAQRCSDVLTFQGSK
jgi:hypothetical protein